MDLAAMRKPTAEYCDTIISVSVKMRSKMPITFPAFGISLSLETSISVTRKTSLIKIFAGFKHNKYAVKINKKVRLNGMSKEGEIPTQRLKKKTTATMATICNA